MHTKKEARRSGEGEGGERHDLQGLIQGRTLLLVVGRVTIPVVAVLKFDPQFTNFGLGEDVRDPLNDERRRFLLIRGCVT